MNGKYVMSDYIYLKQLIETGEILWIPSFSPYREVQSGLYIYYITSLSTPYIAHQPFDTAYSEINELHVTSIYEIRIV